MSTKSKKEAKIKNSKDEGATDFVAVKDGGDDYHVKSVEVESDTKLQDDKGTGPAVNLRFFTFHANPEVFALEQPTAQQLWNTHFKQIEIELWKDGWTFETNVEPRLLFSTDGIKFESYSPQGKQYSHYQIIIAAKPAKGHILSTMTNPQTLAELANGIAPENRN